MHYVIMRAMSDRISVYMNQQASHCSYGYWKDRIHRSLFRSEVNYRTPRSLTELYEALRTDINSGVDTIVSVGGDGTVNTLIQELAGKDVSLLVVPGGTANDLASELGHKGGVDEVIRCIRERNTSPIDLVNINGRYMATNGGIGFGGDVARRINELRVRTPMFKKVMNITGKSIYSFFVAQEILTGSFETIDVEVESKELSGRFTTCALWVNNQPKIADTFAIAPGTRNNDGKFNLVLLTHPTRALLVNCFLKVLRGKFPKDDPHFISVETDAVKLKFATATPFFGDGEIFMDSEEFDIRVAPHALNVFSLKMGERNLTPLAPEQVALS